MKIKALTENLQDYYESEILGKSIILRDLLNIEFPLNALTNDLGEYLGYDEEDFTEEELDSRVIVTDIYADADGFIGAEIKFENRDLNENKATYEELQQQVKQLTDRLRIKTSLGVSIYEEDKEVWLFAYNATQAERWIEKLRAAGYEAELHQERGNVHVASFIMPELKTNSLAENENTLNENATQYRLTLDIVDDEYDLNETLDFYLEQIGGALRVEEQLIKRGEWPIVTFQTPNKNELIELLDIYTGGDSTDFLELIEEV